MKNRLAACGLAFFFLALAGCTEQKMARQPAPRPLGVSPFFADGMANRPQVEGTVARGQTKYEKPGFNGLKTGHGQWTDAARVIGQAGNNPLGAVALGASSSLYTDTFPMPVTEKLLYRGKERYEAFCSMCHGLTGEADGMVVLRGFTKPPSYHIPRLRVEPVGRFYDVITKGFGAMPAHDFLVEPEDRWAIAAYIRALQLSQGAKLDDVPEAEKGKLLGKGGNAK